VPPGRLRTRRSPQSAGDCRITVSRASYPQRFGWHDHGPLGFIANQLELSDAQKTQLKAIWQAESPTVASLLREFAAEQKQMNAASAENLDGSKIQLIAKTEGSTLAIAKLLVEKEKLQSTIYTTVLTPVQRTQADRWRQQWPSRLEGIADRMAHAAGEAPGNPGH
jgi:Spy/CpxP family protein refolding chaperone